MSHRRRLKGRFILLLATMSLLLLAGVYFIRLISTEPVSGESALDQFRREHAGGHEGVRTSRSGDSAQSSSTAPALDSNPNGSRSRPAKTGAPKELIGSDCDWACVTDPSAPAPGLYEYFQCGKTRGQCEGSETESKAKEGGRIGGAEIGREFPSIGYRSVVKQTTNRWKSVHLHHREHEQEFQTSIDSSSVLLHAYRESVIVTGRTFAVDVNFRPALRLAHLPFGLGRSWNGQWRDANEEAHGYYSTQIVARDEIRILGRPVRVWHVRVEAQLTGPKANGNFAAELWMSPELRLTLQEQFDIAVDLEGVPYWGRWRTTITNLEAQR